MIQSFKPTFLSDKLHVYNDIVLYQVEPGIYRRVLGDVTTQDAIEIIEGGSLAGEVCQYWKGRVFLDSCTISLN